MAQETAGYPQALSLNIILESLFLRWNDAGRELVLEDPSRVLLMQMTVCPRLGILPILVTDYIL